MSESAYRKQALKDLSGATRDDLEAALRNLVERGLVSVDAVNGELDKIRAATSEKAKTVSEAGTLHPERMLGPEQQDALLDVLKSRFETNLKLHKKIDWADVEKALKAHPEKMWSLKQLEETGGEPDVIGEESGEFIFGDCSAETPKGRRNLVYDKEAEEYLKEHKPDEKCNGNAADMVLHFGVDFMDEAQYLELQRKLNLDEMGISWLKTSAGQRKWGVARQGFRDAGYGYRASVNNFTASDHYAWRGFRATLRVPKA